MIRIDPAWLASAPLDMRAGTDTALARVNAVFGAAHPHHAYLFTNKRANLGLKGLLLCLLWLAHWARLTLRLATQGAIDAYAGFCRPGLPLATLAVNS